MMRIMSMRMMMRMVMTRMGLRVVMMRMMRMMLRMIRNVFCEVGFTVRDDYDDDNSYDDYEDLYMFKYG